MIYSVALCGLTGRDSRLLEIVINRANSGRHSFHASQAENAPAPRAAIVDASSPVSLEMYQTLRRKHPELLAVTISDHGMAGDTRYRIERKSLFLQVMRVLEDLADHEFTGTKVSSHPTLAAQHNQTAPATAAASVSQSAFVADTAGQQLPLSALVVDDSLTVREQMRMALERLGIACNEADSAEAAMQLLLHNSYNLAFLDVVMPGTDGYELCRKIKHNSYTRMMPVLMLTSRSSPFDRARGALSGCDSYLTKPITWDTFSQSVDKALMKAFRNDRERLVARGYRV
jgi:two-component system, cell cycle response regulator